MHDDPGFTVEYWEGVKGSTHYMRPEDYRDLLESVGDYAVTIDATGE